MSIPRVVVNNNGKIGLSLFQDGRETIFNPFTGEINFDRQTLFTPLFDTPYGQDASAGYSQQLLSQAYRTQPIEKLRRTSDNAEADVRVDLRVSPPRITLDSPVTVTIGSSDAVNLRDFTQEPLTVGVAVNSGYTTFTDASSSGFSATLASGAGFAGFPYAGGDAGNVVMASFDITINAGTPSVSLRAAVAGGSINSNLVELSTSGSKQVTLTSTDDFGAIVFSESDIPSDFTISNFQVTSHSHSAELADWEDATGNGATASQSTAASQPLIVEDGVLLEGPTFDGVDDHLRIADANMPTLTDKLSVSVVCRNASADITSTQILFGQYDSETNDRVFRIDIQSNERVAINFGRPADGTFSGNYQTNGPIVTNELQSIGFVFDAGSVSIYRNGVQLAASIGVGDIPSSIFNSSLDYLIGATNASSPVAFWDGIIHEVYFSDTVADLAAIQQNQMERYNIS